MTLKGAYVLSPYHFWSSRGRVEQPWAISFPNNFIDIENNSILVYSAAKTTSFSSKTEP